jgi:glycosyltransferase involved in cell wall biosynthesis
VTNNRSADSKIGRARILVVLPALGAGGTEHVVTDLANHWAQLGHHLTLVTLESAEAKPYYKLDGNVDIIRLGLPPSRASKLRAAYFVLKRLCVLRAAIKRVGPDVIVSFLTRTNVLTLLATRGLNIPVVVSERNNPDLQPFGSAWKWLRARLYPKAFGLVTMTRGSLEYFPKQMRARGWVIANAIELPADWQQKRGGNLLVAVGRLTHQKGFDLLLEAFAMIAPKFPQWTLLIWGEGEDREKLEAERDRLGLRNRVEMPGVTGKPGVWVETADAFVLSSRYEGWGIVLLEAMAAGLPVVSFDCEWGPRDMITHRHDGLLVPLGDTKGLAESLSDVLGDAQLRKQLATNAALTAQRFNPARIMADWDGVIEAMLKNKSVAIE